MWSWQILKNKNPYFERKKISILLVTILFRNGVDTDLVLHKSKCNQVFWHIEVSGRKRKKCQILCFKKSVQTYFDRFVPKKFIIFGPKLHRLEPNDTLDIFIVVYDKLHWHRFKVNLQQIFDTCLQMQIPMQTSFKKN